VMAGLPLHVAAFLDAASDSAAAGIRAVPLWWSEEPVRLPPTGARALLIGVRSIFPEPMEALVLAAVSMPETTSASSELIVLEVEN